MRRINILHCKIRYLHKEKVSEGERKKQTFGFIRSSTTKVTKNSTSLMETLAFAHCAYAIIMIQCLIFEPNAPLHSAHVVYRVVLSTLSFFIRIIIPDVPRFECLVLKLLYFLSSPLIFYLLVEGILFTGNYEVQPIFKFPFHVHF